MFVSLSVNFALIKMLTTSNKLLVQIEYRSKNFGSEMSPVKKIARSGKKSVAVLENLVKGDILAGSLTLCSNTPARKS